MLSETHTVRTVYFSIRSFVLILLAVALAAESLIEEELVKPVVMGLLVILIIVTGMEIYSFKRSNTSL